MNPDLVRKKVKKSGKSWDSSVREDFSTYSKKYGMSTTYGRFDYWFHCLLTFRGSTAAQVFV
jgi:hypothetical protein